MRLRLLTRGKGLGINNAEHIAFCINRSTSYEQTEYMSGIRGYVVVGVIGAQILDFVNYLAAVVSYDSKLDCLWVKGGLQ